MTTTISGTSAPSFPVGSALTFEGVCAKASAINNEVATEAMQEQGESFLKSLAQAQEAAAKMEDAAKQNLQAAVTSAAMTITGAAVGVGMAVGQGVLATMANNATKLQVAQQEVVTRGKAELDAGKNEAHWKSAVPFHERFAMSAQARAIKKNQFATSFGTFSSTATPFFENSGKMDAAKSTKNAELENADAKRKDANRSWFDFYANSMGQHASTGQSNERQAQDVASRYLDSHADCMRNLARIA
jgi:hypothetical protein